jgi:hypothetical protein
MSEQATTNLPKIREDSLWLHIDQLFGYYEIGWFIWIATNDNLERKVGSFDRSVKSVDCALARPQKRSANQVKFLSCTHRCVPLSK